jgi:hypothetical protein
MPGTTVLYHQQRLCQNNYKQKIALVQIAQKLHQVEWKKKNKGGKQQILQVQTKRMKLTKGSCLRSIMARRGREDARTRTQWRQQVEWEKKRNCNKLPKTARR